MNRSLGRLLGTISFASVLALSSAWSNGQSESSAAGKSVTLNVILMTAPAARGLDKLAREFQAEHPNINANVTYAPEKGYDTKIELNLASGGSAYDVIWSPGRVYDRWVQEKWLTDLTPYIKKSTASLNFDDLLKGSVKFLTKGGQLYGIPIMAATQVLYYRKDIFQNAGIGGPPTTWSQLLNVAKKINSPTVGAVGMRGARHRGGVMWTFPEVLYGYGGRIVKNFPSDMHPVFDSAEAVKAAEYYKDLLRNYGYKGTLSAGFPELSSALEQGKVAIVVDGAPAAGVFEDPSQSAVAGKLGFGMVPAGPVTRWPAYVVHSLSIPSGAAHKEQSWQFIEWATSTSTQLKSALQYGETAVTRKSVLQDSSYAKKFNWDNGGFLKVLAEQDQYVHPFYRPIDAQWGQVEDATGLAMSRILTDQATPVQALKEANNSLLQIYKKAGYISN